MQVRHGPATVFRNVPFVSHSFVPGKAKGLERQHDAQSVNQETYPGKILILLRVETESNRSEPVPCFDLELLRPFATGNEAHMYRPNSHFHLTDAGLTACPGLNAIVRLGAARAQA